MTSSGLAGFDETLKAAAHPWVDCVLTGMILMAGADRLSEALKLMSGGSPDKVPAPARPLEVTGRLILEEVPRGTAAKAASGG